MWGRRRATAWRRAAEHHASEEKRRGCAGGESPKRFMQRQARCFERNISDDSFASSKRSRLVKNDLEETNLTDKLWSTQFDQVNQGTLKRLLLKIWIEREICFEMIGKEFVLVNFGVVAKVVGM